MNNRKVVWLVEDSLEDLEAFEIAAKSIDFAADLRHFSTGAELLAALTELTSGASERKTRWPSLLILDLNLPGLGGKEILRKTKENKFFVFLPIIVLSTSAHPSDVEFCYHFGASAYLVKPMSLDRLEKTLEALNAFWLKVALLPQRETIYNPTLLS